MTHRIDIHTIINFEKPILTSKTFDLFIELPSYFLNAKKRTNESEEIVTDGTILFQIVINQLGKEGVIFSSPGNSMKRHFILWFNSHFSEENIYSRKIEINPKYFDLICEIVKKVSS